MMRKILTILILLVSMTVSGQRIERFVSNQMENYPQLRLLDLYKSCFQDFMGAEHLVSDYDRVKHYLDEELNTADKYPTWDYEPCGIDGRYVRVNVRLVKEGCISEKQLLDAFIRSANGKHPTVKKWSRRWHKIIGTIDKMQLHLPHYDEDRQFIDSLLTNGKYAISHSPEYREAYHPHYRIVERRIFEKELLPLLNIEL